MSKPMMTREMLERFYVELTHPDELGLTDSRLKIVFDMARLGLSAEALEGYEDVSNRAMSLAQEIKRVLPAPDPKLTDKAVEELIDGIKRRIRVALSNPEAPSHIFINYLHGMQLFIIEWERRNG